MAQELGLAKDTVSHTLKGLLVRLAVSGMCGSFLELVERTGWKGAGAHNFMPPRASGAKLTDRGEQKLRQSFAN
ncbi:MAG: hypothetical protein ABJM90_08695 [Paracoccaceae bacterium]